MLTPTEFATFTDAYVAVLRRILEDLDYETAGRGKDGLEVPGRRRPSLDPPSFTPETMAKSDER